MTTMDEDMSDTNRSRKDSVVDINGGAADCEQSAEKVESVELTAAAEARRKYDEAVLSESQALEKYYGKQYLSNCEGHTLTTSKTT